MSVKKNAPVVETIGIGDPIYNDNSVTPSGDVTPPPGSYYTQSTNVPTIPPKDEVSAHELITNYYVSQTSPIIGYTRPRTNASGFDIASLIPIFTIGGILYFIIKK